jgi:hypothetical protein
MDQTPGYSAQTFAWLTGELRRHTDSSDSGPLAAWKKYASHRSRETAHIVWLANWPHDFWMAHGTERIPSGDLSPVWRFDGPLDEWPTFLAAERLPEGTSSNTKSSILEHVLASARPATSSAADTALEQFYALDASIQAHGDLNMAKCNQVRAWLSASLGNLLSAITLTPNKSSETLTEVTVQRLAIAARAQPEFQGAVVPGWTDVDVLYNAEVNSEGIFFRATRQGQGTEWRDHWRWIRESMDAGEMLQVIRITAGILRSSPLFEGLAAAIRQADGRLDVLALCVLRRWLLSLKALTWLEAALSHEWQWVRVQDLSSLAFASISPIWPRPRIAISHRSSDVKSILHNSTFWGSADAAIDAQKVPAWETNTGMIWQLFAATPIIARVNSPNYQASVWCRRELEMSQFFVDSMDFLQNRRIVDLAPDQLLKIASSFEAHQLGAQSSLAVSEQASDFPPTVFVLVVPQLPKLISNLLAAIATLRLLHSLGLDTGRVNQLGADLAQDRKVDLPAPTNNPDGWAPYADLFRSLRDETDGGTFSLADSYPAEELERDSLLASLIPDLSSGQFDPVGVMAAAEWTRTLRGWFTYRLRQDQMLIDCRGLDVSSWGNDPRSCLLRATVQLNNVSPVWILQDAGQEVDHWKFVSELDKPIFTLHFPDQFRWMTPVHYLPTWISLYLSTPELSFDDKVIHSCFRAMSGPFAAVSDLRLQKQGDLFDMLGDVLAAELHDSNMFYRTLKRSGG